VICGPTCNQLDHGGTPATARKDPEGETKPSGFVGQTNKHPKCKLGIKHIRFQITFCSLSEQGRKMVMEHQQQN